MFGAMIVIQIVGGIDDYPVIPPGLVISLIVVGLVLGQRRHRWPSILGAAWPLSLAIGAVIAPQTMGRLTGDDGSFALVTGAVQTAALVLALAAGVLAVVTRYRPARRG